MSLEESRDSLNHQLFADDTELMTDSEEKLSKCMRVDKCAGGRKRVM